jgi:hypothetical protein
MRRHSVILTAFIVVSSAFSAVAEEPAQIIKFGGVWVRGNAADAAKRCPVGINYALGSEASAKAVDYSKSLLRKLRAQARPSGGKLIDLVAPDEYIPTAGSGRALVMACAINYEIIEDGMLPGGILGSFGEIGFDLLVCNFSDRSVVFSLPCRLVFQEKSPASADHLRRLYDIHLPEVFVKLARHRWVGNQAFSTVGVDTVTILQPRTTPDLPSNVVNVPDLLDGQIEAVSAQIAGSRFFDATGIALQPYSNGEEAVFYGLQENLADASTLIAQKIREQHSHGVAFVLRKPDYAIVLKGLHQREKQGGRINYTAQCRIIVKDRSGKEIFNDTLSACADAIPYKAGANCDIWHYSADATVRLFQQFSEQLKQSRKKDRDVDLMFKECLTL